MFTQYRILLFVVPRKAVSGIVWTATASGGQSRSHASNNVPARLAERVCCTKFQSLLLNNYLRLSGFQSSLLLIYFRIGSVHTAQNHGTKPIRHVTFHYRSRRGTASLCHRNRAASQPFLCVNGSRILYDFPGGAKVTRYSENIAIRTSAWEAVNVQA